MSYRQQFDIVVVGGGINGAGIARDAAGRGLSVLLCEKDDLAQHTSSASSKLIHGGLRYLEHREFGLVHKALQEQELLLRLAPHIIWPLRFVMPYDKTIRSWWLLRAGLFLYDHLAWRTRLQKSYSIDLRHHHAGHALRQKFIYGFEYSDAWVQDARLVVLNAQDAAAIGAQVLTRTELVHAQRGTFGWNLKLKRGAEILHVQCAAIVNAAGPWVGQLLHDTLHVTSQHQVRLVKGSHIVVPKRCERDYAYIFQNSDRRIVFALPFEENFTLIGTTDIDYRGDPNSVRIDTAEINYLCAAANHYLALPVTPQDVVWSYAGVRPLFESSGHRNASELTRDYALELDAQGAPALSVFGGKITTYRRLAEEAVNRLRPFFPNSLGAWTHSRSLPGGDMIRADFEYFSKEARRRYAWLPENLFKRYARNYGTCIYTLLGDTGGISGLGQEVLPGLYEKEIEYLLQYEFAQTAQDILWRRTKLGLHLPPAAERVLQAWLDSSGKRSRSL